MPVISLDKKNLPFLLDGASQCAVDTGDLSIDAPIPAAATSVFDVSFSGATPGGATLGLADSVKIGVTAKTSATLTPVFAAGAPALRATLSQYGVGAEGRDTLCFEVKAAVDATATAPFAYSFLKASTQLDAGADAAFAYVRAFDPAAPLGVVVPRFFATMRFPEQVMEAPEAGEAIALEYGGYLRLGAQAAAGYEITGTKALDFGRIALSEKYGLSISGRIGLTAKVAGRFSILVTAGDRPGWARVQVKRSATRDLAVAADVNVGFRNDLDLPVNSREFLGALLGVNAKSYLTLFDKALELSDASALEKAIDGLATKYIEAVVGDTFDALARADPFRAFLSTASTIVRSYNDVGDRAVTLFDRYFDRLGQLVPFLDRLDTLTEDGLDRLRHDLTPEWWTVLAQLTDGDPLGFLLGRVVVDGTTVPSVPLLQERARQVRSLISDGAHAEIRRAIGTAKQRFGLDALIAELSKIDTVDELKARSTDAVGDFVRRLVGRTLGSSADLKEALAEIHEVLQNVDRFSNQLYEAFRQATNSAYTVALHTEYSRTAATDALVDLLINREAPLGRTLMTQVGRGDFEQALLMSSPDVVVLREGTLTHRTARTAAFKVNVLGWHLDYHYEGIDRVVTDASQRLVPSDRGLIVYTTVSLGLDRDRQNRRDRESTHVNFLLQALGQSAGVLASRTPTAQYVVDALNAFTARYELAFTDADTSAAELNDYLAFAKDLGLDRHGATLTQLEPLLPRAQNGGFGPVEASYEVRFSPESLAALASMQALSKSDELQLRRRMRLMLLANYLRSRELHDVAFAYASDPVFLAFRNEGAASFPMHAERTFPVTLPAGIGAPASVTLDRIELERLTTLYNIETGFIDATRGLLAALAAPRTTPAALEQVLHRVGNAMKDFDDFDQTSGRNGVGTSTVFVLFSELVRLADPGGERSVAVLRLTSRVGATPVEKLFMTDAAARG